MECKFKQICRGNKNIGDTQQSVQKALSTLLGNVTDHIYDKNAFEMSKDYLKNKIVSFQVNSIKQVFPQNPKSPGLINQQTIPGKKITQCIRPLSAKIQRNSWMKSSMKSIMYDSKKSINSKRTHVSYIKSQRNSASYTNLAQRTIQKKPNKKNSNEKKFFAVITNHEDDQDRQIIQKLRQKKVNEQSQILKKQTFLRSIKLDSTAFSVNQSRFIQSVSRKKYIYGNEGQIIQIKSSNTIHNQMKKRSQKMMKSRINCEKTTSELNQDQKQNAPGDLYVQFNGRQNKRLISVKDQESSSKRDQKQLKKVLFYNTPQSVYRIVQQQ